MPRFLLLAFALILSVHWSLALFGPVEARDVLIGSAQGATIGAVVITVLAEPAAWSRRPPRD